MEQLITLLVDIALGAVAFRLAWRADSSIRKLEERVAELEERLK